MPGIPLIKSFKTKLFFSYILTILVSFSFIAFFLDKNIEKKSLRDIEKSLINQAYLIENQLNHEGFKKENIVYLDSLVKQLSKKIGSRITAIDKAGIVWVDSEESQEEIPKIGNHLNRPEVKTALNGSPGTEIRYSQTLKTDALYAAVPIKNKNEITGALRLSISLKKAQKDFFFIKKIIFTGLFFALSLAFALGIILTSGIIEPVGKITAILRKYSQGDFSPRIINHAKDEIGEIAANLNNMAQNMEDRVREITMQSQKLSAVFNNMAEGVIVVDKKNIIIYINPAIERIFGSLKEKAEGRVFLEAIRNREIAEAITGVLEKGEPYCGEVSLILPEHKIFQFNAVPIFSENTPTGCVIVIHDITKIRKLEITRKDFVANVSHEIKTPLTSIKGFVETLLEGALDDKENNRNFLKIIQAHAERLNNLVDDLLSLSSLESKAATLDKATFGLKELAEKVIFDFKSQAQKNMVNIKNKLPDNALIKADKDKITQVFANLIDNAIKFNKENGSIVVCSEELNGKIKIIVEDHGIGIPGKDIPRIFERFYRVDKARSRQLGGTGLGLSIVKHIIELHNGTVGVESTEGLGSKFWFTIPL